MSLLLLILSLSIIGVTHQASPILSPVGTMDRSDPSLLILTEIGSFGEVRKARPTVGAHLHAGIDIKRPIAGNPTEPVFAIANGHVISLRRDGPFAQIILEHQLGTRLFWSTYEHISGIRVKLGQEVDPFVPIARFMNPDELNQYGIQFDHLHFEILKKAPYAIQVSPDHPERHFSSRSLECITTEQLLSCFHHPISFLEETVE